MAIYNKNTGLRVRSGDGTVRNNTASIYKPWDPSSIIDRIKEEEQSRSSSLPTYNGSSRIGASAPQLPFEEPIQIGKKDTTPTQVYEEATEKAVITPSRLADIIARIGNTGSGMVQRQASGYAGAAENLLEGAKRLDMLNSSQNKKAQQELENAAHYREMLKRGTLDDGTAIDDTMRANLEAWAKSAERRAGVYSEANEAIHQPISGLINKTDAFGDKMSAGADVSFAKAKDGAGTVGQIAVDLGAALGDVLADAAANAVLPGAGTAARVVRSYGQGAELAEDKGMGLGKQLAYGATSAALGELTNRAFSSNPILKKATGSGALDDIILPGLEKTLPGSVVKSALGEATEGGAESIADYFAQKAIFGDQADEFSWKDVGYDALIDGLVGVATGVSTAGRSRNAAMPGAGTQAVETVGTGKGNAENTVQGKSGGILEQEIDRLSGKSNVTSTQKVVDDVLTREIDRIYGNKNAAPVTVDSGQVTNRQAEAVLADPEQVARLGIDLSGKTKAQQRAAVKAALEAGNPTAQQQTGGKGRSDEQKRAVREKSVAQAKRILAQQSQERQQYLAAKYQAHEAVLSQLQVGDKLITDNGTVAGEVIAVDDLGVTISGGMLTERILPGSFTGDGVVSVLEVGDGHFERADGTPIQSQEQTGKQAKAEADTDAARENAIGTDGRRSIGSAAGGFSPFTAAQMEYGTMDGGENAVRPDDVPVSTNGTDRVSRSVVTAKGAAVTPDEFVPLLENATMNGDFSYIPITNSDTVQTAVERITHVGWDAARAEWTANVRRGRAGADITALGGLLYNHAVNAGDTQAALDIFADYQQAVRNSAQGLQAARILKMMTPDNRLYMIQRSIYSMIERLGLPEGIAIDEELITRYRDADTETERDEIILEMQQNVADQIPSTLLDRWTALRYVNMLGNFKTQVRNISGNVGMRAVSAVKNTVAAALERLTGTERTRSVSVSRDLLRATSVDFENVRGVAMGEGRYSDDRMDPDTFWRGVEERRRIFRSGAMEGYRSATNWAMNNQYFGDEAFTRSAYARALAGYLKAQNVSAAEFTDPAWQQAHGDFMDRARQFAIHEAQETTFRDHNVFSDWVSRVGRRADTPRAIRTVSEGLMPFRRTPANVLYRAEEYSPLGLVNTAVLEIRRRTGGEVTGAEVVNSLAKTLTGTGVFLVGMALANAGALRGADDEDEDQAAFDDLTGRQAYSLELPDGTSVTLDWLTPLAMPLFMGAQLEELRQEDGLELKDLERALLSIADPMLQMSMMQGINDTLSDLRYTDSSNLGQMAATAALGYLTQGLTNSLVGQAERAFEDSSTMNYADKESALPGWLQKEIGAASRKIPGVDYSQVPYIDAWGRQEEKGGAAERIFNNFFNPAYVSKWDVDEVEKELQRVKDATGSTSVFPDRAEKSVTIGGETKALTAEQYERYATALGQERYKLAKEATSSSAYKAMSDADRAACIAKLYSVARAKTLQEIFPDYAPSAELTGYLEAESKGLSPVEFYTFKAGISGAKSDEESSRKEKVMANINAMDIPRKEKDFLFYLKYPKGDAAQAPWN